MPYYRLYYHFVWTTKNRAPFITTHNQQPIFAVIQDKAAALNSIVRALNGMPDHIHLVASVPPSIKLSDFIRQVKGASSHLARTLDEPSDFAWQAEYGVLSISEPHVPTVVRYVENQQKHHADQTLDARLELS
jgi:REP element-mobilizing transposase RayT